MRYHTCLLLGIHELSAVDRDGVVEGVWCEASMSLVQLIGMGWGRGCGVNENPG